MDELHIKTAIEFRFQGRFKHLAMLDQNIQNKHNTRLIQEIFQNKKRISKYKSVCKRQNYEER